MSWLRVKAVARRNLLSVLRSPQRWFDVICWPLVDAILFGSIAVYFAREQRSDEAVVVGTLVAGVLLFHALFQAQVGLAVGFMDETWSRNLLNLLVTPLKESEYVAGVVMFAMAKVAVGLAVVSAVGAALFAFNVTDLGLAAIPMIAVLLLVGYATGLIVIGLILRFGQGAEILTWGFIALWLPLSGIFYPVAALPGWLQPIAQLLPPTHVFEAARTVVQGGSVPWDEIAVGATGALVFFVLSAAFVRWMLAVFRARGFVSRHV